MLYIGRYDWSYHWRHTTGVEFETKFNDWSGLLSEPQEDSAETTSPTPEQLLEEEKQKNSMHNYFTNEPSPTLC